MTIQLNASLVYLQRTTTPETSFDNPANTWNAGDDTTNNVSIGFSFPFNGNTYTNVYITSNGTLSFSDNSHDFHNKKLNTSDAKYDIYPYWDDLNPATGGTIRYGKLGSGSQERFVVWWDQVKRYKNSGSLSLQVVLYPDGSIRFRYLVGSNADGTYIGSTYGSDRDGATIGVKEDATHYDQYAYDTLIDQDNDVLYSPVPPPTDNDYADFHFDELYWDGTDDEIRDSHWNKHGTGYNVSTVKGKICNAIDLSASSSSDYAVLGEGALDGVTNFTIAVWHKGTSGDDSNALLSAANDPEDNEILFWMKNETTFRGHLKDNQKNISTTNINDGNWHHLVWRVKNKKSCFFFDGSKQGCKTHNYSPNTFSVESLILGQDQDNVGGGFNSGQDWEGIVDELLIFRKALSDNEIQTGYNNQNAGKNWDGTDRVCPYPGITKTSCVIDDPVNNTTHPKRIPGATIRYAVKVENKTPAVMTHVIVEDDVSSDFDATTITHLQIRNGVCDCSGVASANNNGANGTGNGVNPVKLDFETVDANTKECGYFEVNIK